MTTIERLDPTDDTQFAAYYEAYRAAHDREWDKPYSAIEKRVSLLESGVYQDSIGLIARDRSGNAVGIGLAEIPLKDNLLTGFVGLRVLPAHRLRGHGSALLDALLDLCRSAGREKVMGVTHWTPGESDVPGRAFADSHGFALDQVEAHRVLDLPASLPVAPARDGVMSCIAGGARAPNAGSTTMRRCDHCLRRRRPAEIWRSRQSSSMPNASGSKKRVWKSRDASWPRQSRPIPPEGR